MLCSHRFPLFVVGRISLQLLPINLEHSHELQVFHYSPVASRISRDRFFELHRYLHFVDDASISPPGTDGYNKLGKVKAIVDMLSERFAALCEPKKGNQH